MRNLFYFIARYHFVILFVFIESFAIFLVVQYNDYQRSCFINSSSALSGHINQMFSGLNQYLGLRRQNESLNRQLAIEKAKVAEAYHINKITPLNIYDSIYSQQYQYIPCQVVNNSVNRSNNYLTLNAGSNQGVGAGMGVVSSEGVIGIVKDVSPNFSAVISVLNQNLKISAMMQNSGYFGSLNWDGSNYQYAILNDLPGHIIVQRGDTIITSGYSVVFPKGQLIGFVDTALNSGSSSLLSVRVKLAADFKRVSHVMVIKNLLKSEQLELEKNIENE
jgi:rod shape-determining protein MreC